MRLRIGDRAPNIALPDHNRNPVKRGEYWGKKNVVLVFYALANTRT